MQPPAGTSKEEFLASVRRALGRSPGPPAELYPRLKETTEELEAQVRELRARLEADGPQLLDRLARVADMQGWKVHRAEGPESAVAEVMAIADSLNILQAVRTDQEVFEEIPLDFSAMTPGLQISVAARNEGFDRGAVRNSIIDAGMGITGADYAVAETGSVVVVPRQGLSRLASLVPPIHVAVVRPQDVVETLDDVFLLRRLEYHRNGGDMGSYLNFITGPSRTADIEQTLVVGVHGPRETHMVLLG
ncbi:MAG: lactate utilization protein [Chloroflexi bacterium]|nr:lactate utilization protein [Chloroflexota bacterium]